MTTLDIDYGNRSGQYFTEWRFDLLRELLQKIHDGPLPGNSTTMEVKDASMWYDEHNDFHMLSFTSLGHVVEVRLYKVFSSKIDGQDHWIGCPRNQVWDYATSIRRKLTS